PNDWTPRSEAYFVFPLAQGTPGKQCGLAATGVYQPSLRSRWLSARVSCLGQAAPHSGQAPLSSMYSIQISRRDSSTFSSTS
ncbi:hypothetical protein, partial [Thiolapillus sp.]